MSSLPPLYAPVPEEPESSPQPKEPKTSPKPKITSFKGLLLITLAGIFVIIISSFVYSSFKSKPKEKEKVRAPVAEVKPTEIPQQTDSSLLEELREKIRSLEESNRSLEESNKRLGEELKIQKSQNEQLSNLLYQKGRELEKLKSQARISPRRPVYSARQPQASSDSRIERIEKQLEKLAEVIREGAELEEKRIQAQTPSPVQPVQAEKKKTIYDIAKERKKRFIEELKKKGLW